MDLNHGASLLNRSIYADYSDCREADIIIITAGVPKGRTNKAGSGGDQPQ